MNLPEKINQPQPNQLATFSGKMQVALQGKRINECTTDELKEALRYGLMILGISADKFGDDLSKAVLINYLFKTYPLVRLEELKLSFDFAVEKRTSPNITLYAGEFISARFVAEILTSYLELKKATKIKVASTPQVNMNLTQRFEAIISLLPKETVQAIKDVGTEKVEPVERKKLPFHDIHQKWFRQFDKLYLNNEYIDQDGKTLPGRWIWRYWKPVNVEAYFNKKAEQLRMAQVRSEYVEHYKIEKVSGDKPDKIKVKKGQIAIAGDYKSYCFLLTPRMNLSL